MSKENKISKAQQKAVNKYVKNNYDRINVTFPKGQKAEIKAHADTHNESVNSFIVRAVNETMTRDGTLPAADQQPTSREPDPQIATPSNTGQEKHYKPFTEEDAWKINLQELLSNIRYQLDIGQTFGMDVLATLLNKARQQAAGE